MIDPTVNRVIRTDKFDIIDNSDIIRNEILKFESSDDFYFATIMWRRKDHPECPANENARILASWCIKNVEYFDRKLDLIRDYCQHFEARCYIKPQVRSCKIVNREILKFIANQIDNCDLAYSTLTREIISGCHKSRSDRIILDFDYDTVPIILPRCIDSDLDKKIGLKLIVDNIIEDIKLELKNTGRKKEKEYISIVPTFNGCHIVTPGFNPNALRYILPKDVWHSDNDTIVYAVKPSIKE